MKRLWPYIILLLVLKWVVAIGLELGNDEAYYYTYTQPMQWSYFDHPFMVAIIQWISTFGLQHFSELNLRALPIIFGLINPIILFYTAKNLGTTTSAFYTSLLYISTLYASIVSGLFILPDAPLSFFFLMALYFSIHFIQRNTAKDLLLTSVFLALAISSKYQAFFLATALLLFILNNKREWLKSPYLYLSFLIAFLGFVPTFIWNAQHDWINFKFHSNRVGDAYLFEFLPSEVIGQILYQNPLVFALMMYAIFPLRKLKKNWNSPILFYFLVMALPLIMSSVLNSIFTHTLPHWSGIAYIPLFILSGKMLETKPIKKIYIQSPFYLLIIIIFVGYFEVQNGYFFQSKNIQKEITKRGKGDPTQDIYGWKQLSQKFEKKKASYPFQTNLIMSHRWYPAGHYDYYLARPLHMDVIAIGPLEQTHEYGLKDNKKLLRENKGSAYFIAQSNSSFRPENVYFKEFEVQALDTIYITRKSDTIRAHFVYLMTQK